jgi:signal transduction histidine kinase
VVAHEVRNPLGVIFNSLGSMRKLMRPTGDSAMLLDIVEEEADRLDRIVRDLLDFARPHEPALDAEDLGELLADTLQAAQGDRVPANLTVDLQVPADLPKLRIDARMIRQVLLNLVLNGMQAMPRGGTLRILAALEPHRKPLVRIEVTDSGTGVPHELAARIFQPFFTTKAAGTGLGLAVVKRFVEAHRGTITFHSRPGEGTTFVLRLPVDEAS